MNWGGSFQCSTMLSYVNHVKSPLKHHLENRCLFTCSNHQTSKFTSSNNVVVQLHCTWTTNNTPVAPPVNAHDLNRVTFQSKQEQYDKITYYGILCHPNITIDDVQKRCTVLTTHIYCNHNNMSHCQVRHFGSTHPFRGKDCSKEVVKSFTSVVENCVFGDKELGVQKVEEM